MQGSYRFHSACAPLLLKKSEDRHTTLFCCKMFQSFIIQTTRKLSTIMNTSYCPFLLYLCTPFTFILTQRVFHPCSKLLVRLSWMNKGIPSFGVEAGLKRMNNHVMRELMFSQLCPGFSWDRELSS